MNNNNNNCPQNTHTHTNSLPVFTVQFDLPLKANRLRHFRGAVIEKAMQLAPHFEAAGIASPIWHQHQNSQTAKVHYRYPLIQYQIKQGKASITAIGEGAKALQIWLQHNTGILQLTGKNIKLPLVGYPSIQYYPIGITQAQNEYRLYKWIAFNEQLYQQWQAATNLPQRMALLQKALHNHLVYLSFVLLPGNTTQIECRLIDLCHKKWMPCYKHKALTFDVVFSTNLLIPPNLGIGKAVSLGFGKQIPVGLYKNSIPVSSNKLATNLQNP